MPNPREQLAQELKQARLDAGCKTHGEFAKKLHVSRSLVAKAESPNQPVPSDALLATWAEKTEANLGVLEDLAKRARGGLPDWFVEYRGAESDADTLRVWGGPALVPGLGQTEEYARSLLAVERYAPERLGELVAARMKRQQIIGRAYLVMILDYAALQRMIGSPQVMAEQCAHVISLAQRPNVSLHVVPEGANVGTWGALNIASTGTLVTVNMGAFEDVPTTDTGLAARALQAFERILGAALNLEDSLDFLQAREGHWKEQI